jgi:hypothetical protein
MLFKKLISVYSKHHTKYITILHGKNVQFNILNQMVSSICYALKCYIKQLFAGK